MVFTKNTFEFYFTLIHQCFFTFCSCFIRMLEGKETPKGVEENGARSKTPSTRFERNPTGQQFPFKNSACL